MEENQGVRVHHCPPPSTRVAVVVAVVASKVQVCVSRRAPSGHKGKIVTTFARGSREFYDWLDGNNAVEAHPCDHTNDPAHARATTV